MISKQNLKSSQNLCRTAVKKAPDLNEFHAFLRISESRALARTMKLAALAQNAQA